MRERTLRMSWIVLAMAAFAALGWWHGSRQPSPTVTPQVGPAPTPTSSDAAATTAWPGATLKPGAGAGSPEASATQAAPPDSTAATGAAGGGGRGGARGGAGLQTHVVRPGETLYRIARSYGTTVDALMDGNSLKDDAIYPGQALVVPGAPPRVNQLRNGQIAPLQIPPEDGEPDPAVLAALAQPGVLVWPAVGAISDAYGYRMHPITGRWAFHSGLDIAANQGDPIRATRAGVVAYAGWLEGYGRTVILDHSDGSRTLYAHASELLVQSGRRVDQGQLIARGGSTGNSTGPHLHFELIVGRPVDPALYLPPSPNHD